jgi:hypothetical protein
MLVLGVWGGRAVHVAVVHADDGVRFVTASATKQALTRQLAEYVEERASEQLWPAEAERTLRALREGDLEQAIEVYFESGSRRWDNERLHTEVAWLRDGQSGPAVRNR